MADLEQHARVDLARGNLTDAAAGEGQQIEVRSQIAGVARLATAQVRLQRQRAAEGQADVRIRRIAQCEFHDLLDEAGYVK